MMADDVRFAGKKAYLPPQGTRMEVVEGDYVGEIVEVLGSGGNAFHPVQKVVVRAPDGETVWYWPWNLRVVSVD